MASKPELEKQNKILKDKIRELEKDLKTKTILLDSKEVEDLPKEDSLETFFVHKNRKGEMFRVNITYNLETSQMKINKIISYGKDIHIVLFNAKKDIVNHIMDVK
jgi:hypothetical protein